MSKLLKVFIPILLTLIMCLQFGCAKYTGGVRDELLAPSGSAGDAYAPGSGSIKADTETAGAEGGIDDMPQQQITIPAGQITAGAQDDNLYYQDWLKLFSEKVQDIINEQITEEKAASGEEREMSLDDKVEISDDYIPYYPAQENKTQGKFYKYVQNDFGLYSLFRVKVTVKNGETPIEGAIVTCENPDKTQDGKPYYLAKTDASGVAYLFPSKTMGIVKASFNGITESADYDSENTEITLDLGAVVQSKQKLIQMMFVIDATGSMGDEMSYLKAELGDVIKRVVEKNENNVTVQLAFLFYRDDGDKEKFAYTDFTDVTQPKNYQIMQDVLTAQTAKGGGDYPEALDEALYMAVSKQWSENSTKLIFNLLDAPCHQNAKNKQNYSSAVYSAAEQGIRICPILASGADLFTEYLTRQAAIMTGGTFIFITDDSGIGGSHLDPDIPNITVELLNDLLVRLIDGYYTGTFDEPVYWKDSVAGLNQQQ